MAEFPVLPIFTDSFISDTLHLNAAQTGAYFMLLMCAWRSKDCSLPDDDNKLAAYARMDKRAWLTNKETIMSFWKKNEFGNWIQKRLIDERKHAEDKRDQAIQAGKASALKRKGRHSTDVITDEQRKSNNPYPTLPTKKNKEEKFLDFSDYEISQFRKQCPSLSDKEYDEQLFNCALWIKAHGGKTPELILSRWLQKAEKEKKEGKNETAIRPSNERPSKREQAKAALLRSAEALGDYTPAKPGGSQEPNEPIVSVLRHDEGVW